MNSTATCFPPNGLYLVFLRNIPSWIKDCNLQLFNGSMISNLRSPLFKSAWTVDYKEFLNDDRTT